MDVFTDGGRTWYHTRLGPDHGKYRFRRWDTRVPLPTRGNLRLMSLCWNTAGVAQPMAPIWNPNGFMCGNIETNTTAS